MPHAPIPWSALDKNPMAEPNSKAILWIKAQHEGAVTPQCIVQKNPQVPSLSSRLLIGCVRQTDPQNPGLEGGRCRVPEEAKSRKIL